MPIITGESPSTWRGSESRPQNDFSFLRGGGVSGGGGKGDLEKKLAESNKANTKAPLPDDEPNGGNSGVTYSKTKYTAHADPNAVLDSDVELGLTFWNKPVLDVDAVLKDIQLQNNIQATQVNTSTLNGISATVLAFVDGATSNIQAQIDAKATGTISLTAGETISGATTPVPVYLASDGKVYKADADSTTPEARNVLGFCITDTTINNSATIQTDGILTVPTITLSETISSTLDQESGLVGSGTVVAVLNSTTQYFSSAFKTGQNTGNISSVELFTDFSVIGTQTRVVDIYAMASDGKPTGSALGTSNGVTSTVSGWHTYTFSTPVTVTPNTSYCLVVRISSYTSGTVRFYGRQYAYYMEPLPTGLTYDSINSGSTWTNANFNTLAMKVYTTNYTAQTFYPLYLSNTAGSYSIQPSATQDATHQPIATIISATQIKIGWELDNKFLAYYNPTPTAVVTSAEQYMHTPKYATTAYFNIAWDGSNQKYGFFILKKHEMTPVSIIDDTGGATEYAITGTWTNSLITLVNSDGTASPFSSIKIYFYS